MKAYVEVISLDVKDIVTTSAACPPVQTPGDDF